MADLTANVELQTQGNGELTSAIIADTVVLYKGALVGYEGGYANHWADGANDTFAGIVVGGDDTFTTTIGGGGGGADEPTLTGDTSVTPAPRVRIETGAILVGLDSVLGPSGGAVVQADVGKAVYCATSNVADMTMNSSGMTHPIGLLDDFRSATDVDVRLFTPAEMLAQATA